MVSATGGNDSVMKLLSARLIGTLHHSHRGVGGSGSIGYARAFYIMPAYTSTLRQMMTPEFLSIKCLHFSTRYFQDCSSRKTRASGQRDLKPQNILHNATSKKLVITDFGDR